MPISNRYIDFRLCILFSLYSCWKGRTNHFQRWRKGQFRQPQQVVSLNNRISPARCDLAPSFDQSMAPPIMAESFNGSPHYGSIFESIKSHVPRSAASPPNGSESNCQVTTHHSLDMGSRKLLNQCLTQHASSLINCGIAMSIIGLMQIVVVNCPTEEWISSDQ